MAPPQGGVIVMLAPTFFRPIDQRDGQTLMRDAPQSGRPMDKD
jgi:hypothetical protein